MFNGKVKKFFDIYGGNSGLTEEFVYNNQPTSIENAVKVYTGSSQNNNPIKVIDKGAVLLKNGKTKKIKWYRGTAIKIVRKGKAGSLILIQDDQYTINDDAYVMQIKTKYANDINIKYILYTQAESIKECVSSEGKGNNGTFNKTLYDERYINIPDLLGQNRIIEEYEKYVKIKNSLEEKIKCIDNIISKTPKYKHGDIYNIIKVFDMISEDRKLTEEYIYNHQGQYPVYSAQIDGAYGYIDSFEHNKEILFVVQYGGSGNTMLRSGKLNVGRNVCGLVPNKEFEGKVNLRFAKYALKSVFINNSKGTDLKSLSQETINNTEFFLPDYNTQIKIANEYEKLETLKSQLDDILKKVNRILKLC